MSLSLCLLLLGTVASAVHGGGLLVWSILVNFRRQISHVPTEGLIRVYRAWGAVSGVSLGLWILSSVGRFPSVMRPGFDFPQSYALSWGSWVENLTTLRVVAFGILWVSYTILEVWTLEPCRQLDKDGRITDRVAYEGTVRKVGMQLSLNSTLFLVVQLLGALGGRP